MNNRQLGEPSDIAAMLFSQMTDLNRAAQEHVRIGRSFMARDVMAIIGTASARKSLAEVVAELIELCGKEAG